MVHFASPVTILWILAAVSVIAAVPTDWPRLDIPGVGLLQGRPAPYYEGVNLFAGVRYAKAPVGDRRWRPPVPAAPATAVVDATSFGHTCPQVTEGEVVGDEDCLFLNVYTPAGSGPGQPAKPKRLPVLVWLHGGSFQTGSSDLALNTTWGPLYDGSALASRGSIVVTVQYRLGPLGFLGSDELRERDADRSSGNYGLQDQRLALQWIQRHITAFGGDPARVMIFGQSAGAASVEMHLLMKKSRGLFSAAAMQSGAGPYWAAQPWADAVDQYTELLTSTSCVDLACLLRLSPAQLVSATLKTTRAQRRHCLWAPVVDGVELTDLPWNLVSRGDFHKVPMIVGFNRDEGADTRVFPIALSEDDFDAGMSRSGIPKKLQAQVKAEYTTEYSDWYWSRTHLSGDFTFSCPVRRFVRAVADAGARVFAYKFSRQPGIPVQHVWGSTVSNNTSRWWGAYHGAEISFVFANPRVPAWGYQLSQEELDIASVVSEHWIALASTGKAGHSWPVIQRGLHKSRWMLLDSPNFTAAEDTLFSHCDLVDAFGNLLPGAAESVSERTVIVV